MNTSTRMFNPEMAAALFRTALQIVFAVTGWAWLNDNNLIAAGSFLASALVTAWGMYARRDTALIESAANVPAVEKIVASPPVANSIPASNVVPPRGSLALLLAPFLAAALFLGGCQTASTGTVAAPPITVADTAVQRAEIGRYCMLVQLGLAASDAYISGPRAQHLLDEARAAVAQVCAAPPSDVPTALAAVARAYTAVVQVRAGRV